MLSPLTGAARDTVYNRLAASYNQALDKAIDVVNGFKLAAGPNVVDAILDLKVVGVTHEINGPITYYKAKP